MKIIRLTTALDFGGVEKRIEISAAEFNKRPNVRLYVVAIGGGGAVSAALTRAGTETILLDEAHKIPSIKTIWRLRHLFKSLQPDVVHTSGAEANFHGLIAAYLAGVKVRIGEEIGFPNHPLHWRKIFKFTYKFATRVIGISQSVVDKIVDLGEVKRDKTVVVHNPVEIRLSNFERRKIEDSTFVYVTVSRLVPIKNLDNLILAFKSVASSTTRPIQLHLVGDGPDLQRLTQLVHELGLTEKVIFQGFQENVAEFLVKADAYILPSFSEGFSIALVEAMLAELVCIATKVGGPSEIISKDVTGLLIDPVNIADIEEKMVMALNFTAEQRSNMGAKARADVLKRFTPEIYIDRLLSVYTHV